MMRPILSTLLMIAFCSAGYGQITIGDTIDENSIVFNILIKQVVIRDSTGEVAYKDSIWHVEDIQQAMNTMEKLLQEASNRERKVNELNEKYEAIIKEMMRRVMVNFEYKL